MGPASPSYPSLPPFTSNPNSNSNTSSVVYSSSQTTIPATAHTRTPISLTSNLFSSSSPSLILTSTFHASSPFNASKFQPQPQSQPQSRSQSQSQRSTPDNSSTLASTTATPSSVSSGSALTAVRLIQKSDSQLSQTFEELTLPDDEDEDDADADESSAQEEEEEEEEDSSSSDDPILDPLEPHLGEVRSVPSLFPHRPSAIYFDYPSVLRSLGIVRDEQGPGADCVLEDLGNRKIFYKCNWERNCVKNAFTRAGFKRKLSGVQWNCAWVKHPTVKGFEDLNRFQKVNHFIGSWCIGRKDRLMRTVNKMKRAAVTNSRLYGAEKDAFDVIPDGWVLPAEYEAWKRASLADRSSIFIIKPSASACGRGIRLIHKNNLVSVPADRPCVIQRYLADPYLIHGKKFDLRIYVLVTSFDPLRCYVFQEGLARFATKPYQTKNLNSRFTHLTNYSVNKKSKAFVPPTMTEDSNSDVEGSKWSLTALWRYLLQAKGERAVQECQARVKDLLVKTLICAEGEIAPLVHRHLKHPGSCYEVFGFDVFLDRQLRPWLIEVNVSPSLMGSSPLDQKIKGTLMSDVFHLCGMEPYDATALKTDAMKEKAARHGRGAKNGAGSKASASSASSALKSNSKRSAQDLWRKNPTNPGAINLQELSEDDWELIFDLEDEYMRKGHFTRLFPNPDVSSSSSDQLKYFQSPRFNNCLMHAWLNHGRPSYVKSASIIRHGSREQVEHFKKAALKKNAASSSNSLKSLGLGMQSQQNASALLAPAAILIPGVNCRPSRCALGPFEEDDSSSWLVPLGAQSAKGVKDELAALRACNFSPCTVELDSNSNSNSDLELDGNDDDDDEDEDEGGRRSRIKLITPASTPSSMPSSATTYSQSSTSSESESSDLPQARAHQNPSLSPSRVAVLPPPPTCTPSITRLHRASTSTAKPEPSLHLLGPALSQAQQLELTKQTRARAGRSQSLQHHRAPRAKQLPGIQANEGGGEINGLDFFGGGIQRRTLSRGGSGSGSGGGGSREESMSPTNVNMNTHTYTHTHTSAMVQLQQQRVKKIYHERQQAMMHEQRVKVKEQLFQPTAQKVRGGAHLNQKTSLPPRPQSAMQYQHLKQQEVKKDREYNEIFASAKALIQQRLQQKLANNINGSRSGFAAKLTAGQKIRPNSASCLRGAKMKEVDWRT